MFPPLRQRLILVCAIASGAAAWLLVLPALRAGGGGTGIALLSGGVLASVGHVLLLVLAGLPAVALGLIASTTGNPMSGIFAVAAALGVLGWVGGPIDGTLRQWAADDALPGRYALLMMEMLFWQAAVVGLVMLVQRLRSPMRSRWPALAFDDHLGVDTHYRFPQTQAVLAGVVAAVAGGILAWILIRDGDVGQVFWSLVLAFTLGSLIAQLTVPQRNPVGILFAPAVVALASYAWVLWTFDDTQSMLLAWFNLNLTIPAADRITGAALALPIHYASAGVMGCAMGVGWAQVIAGERDQ